MVSGELLSLAGLEEFAATLACLHAPATGKTDAQPLLPQIERSARVLESVYAQLSDVVRRGFPLMPGDEWLLDNYHIVQATAREVRVDLPARYYLKLPRLQATAWRGFPRVYALASELILHTDCVVDTHSIEAFVRGYQSVIPLQMGELWAVPAMLRAVLVESLAGLADELVRTRAQFDAADALADQLITRADALAGTRGAVLQVPAALVAQLAGGTPPSMTLIARLLQQLRAAGPAVGPTLVWLEETAGGAGVAPQDAIRADFNRQAMIQTSISNAITSMRAVAAVEWPDFVERWSHVESILRSDPADVYARMTFATRDTYRHAVERLARRSGRTEQEIAGLAVALARAAPRAATEARAVPPLAGAGSRNRYGHVGYYLVDDGWADLRKAAGYRAGPGARLLDAIRVRPTAVYLLPIAAITLAVLGLAVLPIVEPGSPPTTWAALAVLLAALLPASEFAVRLVNQVVSLVLAPRVLPKLDYSAGIPAEHRTFVVIPTLFRTANDADGLVQHIELLYLANPDPHLHFAILSDFTDAPSADMPDDAAVLAPAIEGVTALNVRYGQDRFHLLHRRRQWNAAEGVWMGWERKRGKLTDFNALLRGEGGESFTTRVGDASVLAGTQFVITLDTDTDLPRDAARRLIGTLAHPLNRAVLDPVTHMVRHGYGFLQPRVSTTWSSAGQTLLSRIYAGQTGIDPYTTAVSDVYQDLFGEAIFIGKGIYDVDAVRAATDGRFPSNTVLSHDLLEGSFARAGLVSDVELYEDVPARYNTHTLRDQRWIRGDWQLLGWLRPMVPTGTGREPNQLSLISRWRILDNLRRSLVAPAVLVLLVLAWTRLSGLAAFFTLGILVTLALPIYAHLITVLGHKSPATTWRRHLTAVLSAAATNLAHFALTVTFLADRAWYSGDAVLRTLARLMITHRHLLVWVTAQEATRSLGTTRLFYVRHMWYSPVLAIAIGGATLLAAPASLVLAAPFLLLWAGAPWIAYQISQPLVPRAYTASAGEIAQLRRIARRSWRYFEDFVGPDDRWLAPDNFQEDPPAGPAHRTSPTNLSMLLLSTLSAYDLGYLGASALAARLGDTLDGMERLERYQGHFLNWYDTRSGDALLPRYVSTVDSGNLVGHLLALRQGCIELPQTPLFAPSTTQGLRDLLGLIGEELERARGIGGLDVAPLRAWLAAVEALLSEDPADLPGWSRLLAALAPAAAGLLAAARGPALSRGAPARGAGQSTPPRDPAERGHPAAAPAAALQELEYWAGSLESSIVALQDEIAALFPWAAILAAPIPPALDAASAGATSWRSPPMPVGNAGSLTGNLGWCAGAMAEIARLQAALPGAGTGSQAAAAHAWLAGLNAALGASMEACGLLATRFGGLADQIAGLADEMRFDFLFDETRRLFRIGYNVDELRPDNAYYDLLASESRLAGYVAIARGEVPEALWFQLGRPLTGAGSGLTLLSWTGTMFEYLMPDLVLARYPGTLLGQAGAGTVRQQQAYAQGRNVPWGISEAAYNMLGQDGRYQYRAFGVPGLGLKRGLSEDLVVAPYATLLALPIAPAAALANLRHLARLGLEGRYGLYELIDYTPSRLSSHKEGAIVATYMVHHVGMGLVAINNYLNNSPIVRRFALDPVLQTSVRLLQERIPVEAPRTEPHPGEGAVELHMIPTTPAMALNAGAAHDRERRAHLLSNGRYSVMITSTGGGYSRLGPLALTRWREDPVGEDWGSRIYIRDVSRGAVWAAAAPPAPDAVGHSVYFRPDKAEFLRRDGDIETQLEIAVSPEDDAEVRRLTLTNRGRAAHTIEVTSYAEVVLAPQPDDESQPAFSKLFVETQYLPAYGALLARRRPRAPDEAPVWLMHLAAVAPESAPAGGPQAAEYETDRAVFLGRGRSPAAPAALSAPLQGHVGAVLDPIVSLRKRFRIAPGGRVHLSFVTAAAGEEAQAHALADKYNDYSRTDRAFGLAATQAGLELRHLGITADDAQEYQRLFSAMIYSRAGTRAPAEVMARNTKGQSGLWSYGISGDLPILLVMIADPREVRLVQQALQAHEYWLSHGFQADLVVLDLYPGGYIQPVSDDVGRLVAAGPARGLLNQPGGVHIRHANSLPEADRILLRTVARVTLTGSAGSLARQLDRAAPQPSLAPALAFARTPRHVTAPLPEPARPALAYDNGLGGFDRDRSEYVITLRQGAWTPLPWTNVIANPGFGCLVTESGLGASWSENSRENWLTPWSNDPVSDPPSEVLYIRDEASGQFWTPTPLPIREKESYTIRHGQGYSRYEHASHGIEQSLLVFVPPEDPVKVCMLTLRNRSGRPRRLAVTYYAAWVLGVARETMARYVITDGATVPGAILARNPYNSDFGDRVAFAAIGADAYQFTGDRQEFVGVGGTLGAPAALRRPLSGRVGAGLDPCAALQCVLDLSARSGATGDLRAWSGRGCRGRGDARGPLPRRRPGGIGVSGHAGAVGARAGHGPGANAGRGDGSPAQSVAALSVAVVPRLGAIGLLPGRRRVWLPRPATGCHGARPCRAGARPRAGPALCGAPVQGGRRAALVAPARGPGRAHPLLRRPALAALRRRLLRVDHR